VGKIRILDEGVVTLIAAGEVVEGPWSVVKELMENALDAGASRLEVSLAGGGFDEIRVTDDGCGMDADDLALAFARHATSKVARAEDLDAIATMGFRGEALAAVAGVSRVTVLTRAAGDDVGLRAEAEGGRVRVAPEGAPPGTTVIVRDLYYNVPARRKFAGQPAAEWRRAVEVFKRLALARLAPAFTLAKDRRLQYAAAGGADARRRIGEILGWDAAAKMAAVAAEEGEVALEAYLAPPNLAALTTNNIYTIINGRPARAKPTFKAVMAAYEGRLERGRYPLVVLYLTLPERRVDVNVHPRKEEVRFDDDGAILDVVSRALRRGLAGATVGVAAADFAAPAAPSPPPAPAVTAVREAVEGYLREHKLWPASSSPRQQTVTYARPQPLPAGKSHGVEAAEAGLEVLGQLDDTYIIVRRGRDLVVVDQHTAHERVIYDRLAARPGRLTQELLLPATVTLPAATAADLTLCLPALAELGFDVEPFGGGAFLVRGLPSQLAVGDADAFLRRVVEDFVEAARPASAEGKREAMLRSVACRAAVMAGERLDFEEMAALVRDLLATATPEVCPHGRPTMVHLEARALERLFQRQ